jgi:hypothetical protein
MESGMKIRVLVEVSDGAGTVRRLRSTEVTPKVLKMYEALGTDDMKGFLADDVVSNAIAAVQPQKAMAKTLLAEGKELPDEKELGLDIIENMIKKGIA